MDGMVIKSRAKDSNYRILAMAGHGGDILTIMDSEYDRRNWDERALYIGLQTMDGDHICRTIEERRAILFDRKSTDREREFYRRSQQMLASMVTVGEPYALLVYYINRLEAKHSVTDWEGLNLDPIAEIEAREELEQYIKNELPKPSEVKRYDLQTIKSERYQS